MIAAATPHAAQMSIGWFDGLLAVMIGFGMFRGRSNGMAKELLPLVTCVALVLICGFGYSIVGQIFINTMKMDIMWSYILSYVILVVVIYVIFAALKAPVAKKMEGNNMFGSSEYYLGMLSGMIRFVCIVLMVMALLNAPVYTAAQVQAHNAYVQKTYGGGVQGFSGDFFPTMQELQEAVFEKSFSGPFIKNYLGVLFINTAPPGAKKAGAKH